MASHEASRRTILAVAATVMLLLCACGASRKVEKGQSADGSRQESTTRTDNDTAASTPTPQHDLSDIHFDFDRAHIRPGDREILTGHGRWLSENRSVRLLIEGHCDERGTAEYNLALGERRAEAARDYLESYGISRDRLEIVSYGEERPLAAGHDEQAWALNRRAHFVKR